MSAATLAAPARRHVRWVAWPVVAGLIAALDVRLFGRYAAHAASVLRHPALLWMVVALVAELISMAAAGALQRRMLLAGGRRVPVPTMIGLAYAANALSASLPVGSAVSTGYTFRRLRRLGATVPAAGFTLLSSGLLSTLAYAVLSVVGLGLAGGVAGGLGGLAIAALLCAALVVAARWVGRRRDAVLRAAARGLSRANRLLHRPSDAGLGPLRGSVDLLQRIRPRARDWAAGSGFALANWVADVACLLAACRAAGTDRATVGVVLLAYVGGMSVSSFSVVPGGLGVVDAAFVVLLVRGGIDAGAAAAGVVLYRLVSFAFVVLAGWLAWGADRISARGAATPPGMSVSRGIHRGSGPIAGEGI